MGYKSNHLVCVIVGNDVKTLNSQHIGEITTEPKIRKLIFIIFPSSLKNVIQRRRNDDCFGAYFWVISTISID